MKTLRKMSGFGAMKKFALHRFEHSQSLLVLIAGHRGTGRTTLSLILGKKLTEWHKLTHVINNKFTADNILFQLPELTQKIKDANWGEVFILEDVMGIDLYSRLKDIEENLSYILGNLWMNSNSIIMVTPFASLPTAPELLEAPRFSHALRDYLKGHLKGVMIVDIETLGVARFLRITRYENKLRYHTIGVVHFTRDDIEDSLKDTVDRKHRDTFHQMIKAVSK